MIKNTNKDIYWSYFAQIFSVFSGIIILPFILKLLTPEEVGFYYLLISITSLVVLFDFGFAPQFARNISYIYGGAQELKKEGVNTINNQNINYRLLTNMIHTAKVVYKRLAFVVLLLMISIGTLYISKVTNDFKTIENSFIIWMLFSVSISFNIYYSYYSSILIGAGKIKESKKANFYSKLSLIILTILFLKLGYGIFGVALANFICPFVNRYLSYKYYFSDEIKLEIGKHNISKREKLELFKILWFNTKKLGFVFLGSFAVNRFSIFIAGLFLSLSEVGSLGIMLQFFSLLMVCSSTIFNVNQPRFSSLRTTDQRNTLLKEFSFTMNIYYILFLLGSIIIILFGPFVLELINSNTILPSTQILILFSIVVFLEGNHSIFASFIVTGNTVPFVNPSLIAAFFIIILDYIILDFSSLKILGLVLVQGLVQLAYANWKWPLVVLNDFKISFLDFIIIGIKESNRRIKSLLLI
tara:strand:- start:942 stop:2351 length:1410 start_codon:yes stop_codon:yes gene_type:complete